MNANELADYLDNLKSEYLIWEWAAKAQAMLRQQQAEIEALKARCNSLKKANDGFARHLISNPIKEQLTDEEIYDIAWHFQEEIEEYASGKWAIPKQDFVEFARAILRKAQEK